MQYWYEIEKGNLSKTQTTRPKSSKQTKSTNGSYSLLTFIFHFKILPERNNRHGQNTKKYYRPH